MEGGSRRTASTSTNGGGWPGVCQVGLGLADVVAYATPGPHDQGDQPREQDGEDDQQHPELLAVMTGTVGGSWRAARL